MSANEVIFKFEREIRFTIKHEAIPVSNSGENQAKINQFEYSEVQQDEYTVANLSGALSIFYVAGSFLSVDRIIKNQNSFKKQRRIIFYLDSRPGQIASTLFLQLLKIKNGEEFSKHRFIQRIDKEFFQSEGIIVSSGEINEALSRMFRKTMINYFGEDGRTFLRSPFSVRIHDINISNARVVGYNFYKTQIDYKVNSYISELNRLL